MASKKEWKRRAKIARANRDRTVEEDIIEINRLRKLCEEHGVPKDEIFPWNAKMVPDIPSDNVINDSHDPLSTVLGTMGVDGTAFVIKTPIEPSLSERLSTITSKMPQVMDTRTLIDGATIADVVSALDDNVERFVAPYAALETAFETVGGRLRVANIEIDTLSFGEKKTDDPEPITGVDLSGGGFDDRPHPHSYTPDDNLTLYGIPVRVIGCGSDGLYDLVRRDNNLPANTEPVPADQLVWRGKWVEQPTD